MTPASENSQNNAKGITKGEHKSDIYHCHHIKVNKMAYIYVPCLPEG
jgi:hypothetical protein